LCVGLALLEPVPNLHREVGGSAGLYFTSPYSKNTSPRFSHSAKPVLAIARPLIPFPKAFGMIGDLFLRFMRFPVKQGMTIPFFSYAESVEV